jgi:hypothetical protein
VPDEPTPPSRAVAASPDVSRADPSRGWRLRLFVDTHDEPRARRATDVIVLAGVLLALGLLGLVAVPASGVEAAVSRVLDALPDLLDVVWRALGRALVVVAVVLAIAATVRRQFALVRDMAAAGAAAAVLALLGPAPWRGGGPTGGPPPPRRPCWPCSWAGSSPVTGCWDGRRRPACGCPTPPWSSRLPRWPSCSPT